MVLFTCCQHRTALLLPVKNHLWNSGCFLVMLFLFVNSFPPVISKLWKHLFGGFSLLSNFLQKKVLLDSDVLWYLLKLFFSSPILRLLFTLSCTSWLMLYMSPRSTELSAVLLVSVCNSLESRANWKSRCHRAVALAGLRYALPLCVTTEWYLLLIYRVLLEVA